MKTLNQFLRFSLIAISSLWMIACSGDDTPAPVTSMDQLEVSDHFNFDMTQGITIRIETQDNTGAPMSQVRVDVYKSYSEELSDGELIFSGFTNENGVFVSDYLGDFVTNKLYAVTGYIGLPAVTEFILTSNEVDVLIGGPKGNTNLKSSYQMPSIAANYTYLCTFNSSGVPSCLVNPGDIISADLLADINAALPEYSQVPSAHSNYLSEDNVTDVVLLEDADVWITFVHEGASYRNTIAYYTYDLSNPPTTPAEISLITIAFPNASYSGSSGGLASGDKIYLGQFEEGTGIGWVLIANAFSNNAVNTGAVHYYSNPDFNPENNPNKRQHTVLLYDPERELFLIGFEDINRLSSSCDHDFNDAIFYVTSNPVEAIQTTNVPLMDPTLLDTDEDGVVDLMDDYPNDPDKAFNNYFPSRTEYGGLAFEDLWPAVGDYDFNDMVLAYRINHITNAENLVTQIEATYRIEAIGAGFKNGFGFELNLSPALIENVSGMNLQEGIITLSSNNTEANQPKAVIIPFDNTYNLFDNITSGFVNTRPTMDFVQPDSVVVIIDLTTPQTMAAVGLPPYNPFIFIDKERGREVHLPGYAPTALADTSYFGTEDDDTDLAINRYYKSKTNLPWGMHTPVKFDYPIERSPIIEAHLTFGQWVQSSGFSYMDWYMNKQGYRQQEKIYSKQ
jgi:LruC domain-containing protein